MHIAIIRYIDATEKLMNISAVRNVRKEVKEDIEVKLEDERLYITLNKVASAQPKSSSTNWCFIYKVTSHYIRGVLCRKMVIPFTKSATTEMMACSLFPMGLTR